ncbi:ribonuclease H-like domain-containing protein, partial [Tanacetum coccineum]
LVLLVITAERLQLLEEFLLLVTTKEKVQKKNDVKARSMLLMALPNEYLMTFNQYKDAQTLFAAIQTRFGGNEATKKTQKTLLKQMYENFSAPSTESLDFIFNRLQKIVSQLAILGENISQEDLNLKFLRSLPFEWNTHVVVWRNKPDLDTMSFDDLYNNFKIVEQEVKGTASSSSSSQNMDFVSSPNITNEVNTAYEDLEQIHEDDIEEMDLKWQLALMSMRTKRFFQKTGRKITINGSDIVGYDKSKVECFNCHKMGHFARECSGPRNQDSRNRNQDSSRRTVNVKETSSKSMLAIDGASFDWSYMADEEVPTNMALVAFSDSEVHNDKTCLKTCLKSFKTLRTQLDDLRIEFNKFEFNLATYKRGLVFVEEQLVFYKKNEVIFYEQLAVLKRDISYKDSEISMLKSELEKLKQEKESNQLKIENFDNASKSLDKLIGSQITDKSRKGVGFVSYNVVPPPPTGLFSPPNLDLSYSGLEEFQQPEFEGYGPKTSKSVSEDISNEVRESPDAPLVEELVSDDKLEKKTIFPTVAKIEFVRPKQQEKPVRKPVKYAEMYSFDMCQAGTTIPSSNGGIWNIIKHLISTQNDKNIGKPKKSPEISQSSGPTNLVADEIVHEERRDSVERVTTTATSLDVEQGSGVNTPRSDEERIELKELMDMCTKLFDRVLDLENVKDAQALKIKRLKKRVKKLEKKKKSKTPNLKNEFDQIGISWFQADSKNQGRTWSKILEIILLVHQFTTPILILASEPVYYCSVYLLVLQSQRLQVKLDEEARLEREREVEASKAANIAEWITGSGKKNLIKESSKRQKTGDNESRTSDETKWNDIVKLEGNRHLHAGREGVSIVKRNSYIDAGQSSWWNKIMRCPENF